MLRKAALLAAFLGVLAGAPLAHASELVKRPAVTWIRGDGSFTKASRGKKQIHTIVIHATDGGSLLGNVWWLSGGHSHASAHYVVSRDGSIVQLVHLSDIAWHAGNWQTNVHSIGIEHVGETYDPAGFTKAEYAASAKLVAWLVQRYDIPVDRKHIIGHSQVPDPKRPRAPRRLGPPHRSRPALEMGLLPAPRPSVRLPRPLRAARPFDDDRGRRHADRNRAMAGDDQGRCAPRRLPRRRRGALE